MTLEEIETKWKALDKSHLTGSFNEFYFKAKFTEKYFPKLIAVAMAAKDHIELCEDAGICDGELEESLTNLEKDE